MLYCQALSVETLANSSIRLAKEVGVKYAAPRIDGRYLSLAYHMGSASPKHSGARFNLVRDQSYLSFSLSLFLAIPLPQNANFHIPILPFPKLLVYFQMLLNPQLPTPSPASTQPLPQPSSSPCLAGGTPTAVPETCGPEGAGYV